MESVTNLRPETADRLKELVKMNIDAAKGFSEAADRVESEQCAALFRTAADRRSLLAADLQGALSLSDEDIPDSGTALGFLHRSWLNVRGALDGGDTKAMLAEAVRGESHLVDAYKETLRDTAGSPLNATLSDQLAEVKATRDSIEALRDAAH